MSSGRIQFEANGAEQVGYVSGSGPGIIVIQEWWGLVDHIERVTDRFAAAGFTAFAPDFYQGVATAEPDEASSMMMALQIEHAERVIRGAVSALLSRSECSSKSVGIVGFCMGGQLAMFGACLDKRISACVNFYGVHPHVSPAFEQLEAPILGHFAARDHMTTPDVVAQLDRKLTELNKPHEFHSYDADHAFFNDDRLEVYDAEAATLAWDRTLKFFRDHVQ